FLFLLLVVWFFSLFFFLYHPAPSEIYTLSLHDALPIFDSMFRMFLYKIFYICSSYIYNCISTSKTSVMSFCKISINNIKKYRKIDRKSTRLNSSHVSISYAVFCLKKKKKTI